MKRQIILWIAALLITYIFGYLNRITSNEYPVTGTVKYNTHKVSYLFDRVYRGDDKYKFQIFSDLTGLKGTLQFRKKGETNWKNITLKYENNIYQAYLPKQSPGEKLLYRASINYNNERIIVPNNNGVEITFWSHVSNTILLFYNFSLFFGLFLTTRIGLEFFNDEEKIKKLSIFPIFFFIFYGLLVVPIKHTYELGAIGNKILPINSLFDIRSISFLIIWTISIILIFNTKKRRFVGIISAIILLLIYGINI